MRLGRVGTEGPRILKGRELGSIVVTARRPTFSITRPHADFLFTASDT